MSSAIVQNKNLWLQSTVFHLRLSQECVCFDFYFKSFVIILLNGDCVISYSQHSIKLCKAIRPHALTTVFLTLSSISAPPVTHSSISVWRRKEKLINTNCLLQMYKFVLSHLHFTGCMSHFRFMWSSCRHSLSVLCSLIFFAYASFSLSPEL